MRPQIPLLAALALGVLSACFSDNARSPLGEPTEYLTDVAGLKFADKPRILDVKDGDTLTLEAFPVKKTMMGREVRMLAFNGSIPGPTIRAKQGTEIIIKFKNRTGFANALHSHGVRLDNRFDGADAFNQTPVPNGESFTYRIRFPDAGVYWYHAHKRSDYFVEMGMYGNYLVTPSDSTYWGPADREEMLVLDDFLLDTVSGKPADFSKTAVNRSMMGRFGNVWMINGDSTFNLQVKRKELVRFYVTNTSNARVFNFGFQPEGGGPMKMKVVGSDNGRYEMAWHLATEILAPSERTVVEAYFDKPGTVNLVHKWLRYQPYNDTATFVLGRITVLPDSVGTEHGARFAKVDTSLHAVSSIDSVRSYQDPAVPPDKVILLTGRMGAMAKTAASQHDPGDIPSKGIEWWDHMEAMNRLMPMNWFIRELYPDSGKENHAIQWKFRKGQKVKIRIQGDASAANSHPMPHPIHFHGQRFLVLYVNGDRRNRNLVWKDTHLIGVRETVDILLDAGNPGIWMAHCHVNEHAEARMMFHYEVTDN